MIALKNQDLLRTQGYINGKWVNAKNNTTFSVLNPFDQSIITNVADLGVAETKEAIEAANEAWSAWRSKTAKERGQCLLRWAEQVRNNLSDLTLLLTTEQGKPLEQSKMDINYIPTLIEWFAAEAMRLHGQTITPLVENIRLMTIRQPIGVVAAIAPWNFPASLCMQQCVPAIAVGCTVVFKPAEQTPLTILALARLSELAGLPPGVFNVIPCEKPAEIGKEFTTNPLVRKLCFTGSTATGKLLAKEAASTIKKITLELGGNCPFILFADANVDAAIDQAIELKFLNAGQVCNGINRFLVEDSIYDDVVAKFVEKAKKLKVGAGIESDTTMGPVISEAAIKKIERLVEDAVKKGAQIKLGGKSDPKGKWIYQPTVLSDVPIEADMFHEEIFGPVAPFYRFKSEEEALRLANDTKYGLAAYFYTQNPDRIHRLSEALEAGLVGANTTSVFGETLPFGGCKESGIGREGGVVGSLDGYCEIKTIATGSFGT